MGTRWEGRQRLTNKTAAGKPPGYERHYTVSEIAAYLGIAQRTVERWHKKGTIPEPATVTEYGWKLWSPEQAADIFRMAMARREKKRKR